MKVCPTCAASNVNSEEFCTDCGLSLKDVLAQAAPEVPSAARKGILFPPKNIPEAHDNALDRLKALLSSIETLEMQRDPVADGHKHPNALFLLDFTGNTGGKAEVIQALVNSFADGLRAGGFKIRVGLIEFRDRPVDENGNS